MISTNQKIYSINEIADKIFNTINKEESLRFIIIRGEITSINKKNQFAYIELRDDNYSNSNNTEQSNQNYLKSKSAKIKVVVNLFSYKKFNMNEFKVGDIVLCQGSLSYYKEGYNVSLWASEIEVFLDQLGKALLKRKKTIEILTKDGILNKTKKEIPQYINTLGIITGYNSAAYNDIINTLNSHFPVNTFLFPAIVQGESAPKSIISALEKAYKSKVEVIILARGGGSKTDLYCFDDEALARKIASSPVPIITSIGHSIDFTICDLVSDKNTITPTEGASLINPLLSDINNNISYYDYQLETIFSNIIYNYKQRLDSYNKLLKANSLTNKISNLLNNLKQYNNNLNFSINRIISYNKNNLNNYSYSLNYSFKNYFINKNNLIKQLEVTIEKYNQDVIIKKGYVQIFLNNNQIKNIKSIKTNDEVDIVFSDGRKKAVIK